jgi:hypothetical protein
MSGQAGDIRARSVDGPWRVRSAPGPDTAVKGTPTDVAVLSRYRGRTYASGADGCATPIIVSRVTSVASSSSFSPSVAAGRRGMTR